MRDDPVTFARVLRALELFGPQARPYNFDDHFDCWGLARRVFDWLDDGYELDEQLGGAGSARVAGWRPIGTGDDLLPGDLLTTHPCADDAFHTVFYCGRVDGLDLVYDSSPRGLIPVFERRCGGWYRVADRGLVTKYARAPESTDRLRNDGSAYLRLWDDRERYYNVAFHARLKAGSAGGGAAGGRDLVAQRRAAGFSELPFYCVRRLPRDAAGREVYDNLLTRHLDYYVPDGAPLLDDAYESAVAGGPAPDAQRPPSPSLVTAPPWLARDEPVEVAWSCGPGSPAADGCRIEVWEETYDLWKRRLLREERDGPRSDFRVPREILRSGHRFAVVVYARADGKYSPGVLAPFLYRPKAGDPLLAYNPFRPERLRPDAAEVVAAGRDVTLTWSIREPELRQSTATVALYEGAGCPAEDEPPVWRLELAGVAARSCRCEVPAAVLRSGATYYWYVMPRDRDGRAAYAPAEGVFAVAEGG